MLLVYLGLCFSTGGITGQSNEALNHTQPGNPFVYRDPCTFPAPATGSDLFGPVHDQQHTAIRSTPTKAGLHLGGPFSSNRLAPPVVRTPTGGVAQNFQLVYVYLSHYSLFWRVTYN